MIISFFNKTISKSSIYKKALTFRRLFFKCTKEKMKIGYENRKCENSIVYYYIFYFFFKNILIKCKENVFLKNINKFSEDYYL